MDVSVRWINRSRSVVQYTFSGAWAWDDFYAAFEQAEPCDPALNICVLIDLRGVIRLPSDAILNLKRAAHLAERATGVVILIATDVHAVTMYELFLTLYKPLHDKFRLVASEEEALAILQMPD